MQATKFVYHDCTVFYILNMFSIGLVPILLPTCIALLTLIVQIQDICGQWMSLFLVSIFEKKSRWHSIFQNFIICIFTLTAAAYCEYKLMSFINKQSIIVKVNDNLPSTMADDLFEKNSVFFAISCPFSYFSTKHQIVLVMIFC